MPDLETFQRDFKAAQNRLRPLGRRGWEARRSELLRDLAKLENYPRLSKAQEQELEDLTLENQAAEALITEDDLANERQREAIRSGFKAGTLATEGGAIGVPDSPGRARLLDDEGALWIRQSDGPKATVSRSQSFTEHPVVDDYQRALEDLEALGQ